MVWSGCLVRLALVAASGCGGTPIRDFLPGHDGGVDTAPPIDLAPDPDGPPDAAPCTTLATSTDPTAVTESGAAPAPTGGAIANGVYVLDSFHAYGGTAVVQYKLTWRFSGANWEYAERPPSDTEDRLAAGTLTVDTSAHTFTITVTCGGGASSAIPYSFDSGNGTLDIITTSGPVTTVTHYLPM